MRRQGLMLMLAAVCALAFGAASASARTTTIESFDGTTIKVNFFPTDAVSGGGRAPTVLFGPGWSSPGDTDPESATDPTIGAIGVGPLRAAGYNVLTWDPRGFGDSGGVVQVDSPDAEARDVKRLVSFVARQPEAKLDGRRDPRVGMTGASYGGGIQLSAAAIDRRIDVIAPDIAWNSLRTSLYQDDTFKSGWGSILYALGKANGNLDPHIDSAFSAGSTTGRISSEDEQWFADRGPDRLVKKIRIPTFLLQGTVDTLFPLDEAIANYRTLSRSDVPLKMLWFCGGHGSCLTDQGNTGRIEKATLAWLDRWLARDRSVRTGPGFEWIDQDGKRFTAKRYPRPARMIEATGEGTLPVQQAGGSGPSGPGPGVVGAIAGITNGTRALNAVNIEVEGKRADREIVGTPRIRLDYSGTATDPDTRIFAQLVDDETGIVLGNQVTPIPVRLDGKRHVVRRPLEAIAHTLHPGSGVILQIMASATNWGPQRSAGAVDLDEATVRLPVVKAKSKR
ncbi:MAG: CocE/NonD family hydrolase [Solirubrobacterales bacterium]